MTGTTARPTRPSPLVAVALLLAAAGAACAEGAGEGAASDRAPREARVAAGESSAPQESAAGGAPRVDAAGRVVRTTRVTVGGVPITVEIADTPELREQGLMARDSLAEDTGMLFVYAEEGRRCFWMRNTPLPLSIAFLDRTGLILNIERMDPHTDDQHCGRAPAAYALEMAQGWFEERGIEAGDRLEF